MFYRVFLVIGLIVSLGFASNAQDSVQKKHPNTKYFSKGKSQAARCVVNADGHSRCAPHEKGKCMAQKNKHIKCGFGECVMDKRGNVTCSGAIAGQCIIDKTGYAHCSSVENGTCRVNKSGYAICDKSL